MGSSWLCNAAVVLAERLLCSFAAATLLLRSCHSICDRSLNRNDHYEPCAKRRPQYRRPRVVATASATQCFRQQQGPVSALSAAHGVHPEAAHATRSNSIFIAILVFRQRPPQTTIAGQQWRYGIHTTAIPNEAEVSGGLAIAATVLPDLGGQQQQRVSRTKYKCVIKGFFSLSESIYAYFVAQHIPAYSILVPDCLRNTLELEKGNLNGRVHVKT